MADTRDSLIEACNKNVVRRVTDELVPQIAATLGGIDQIDRPRVVRFSKQFL